MKIKKNVIAVYQIRLHCLIDEREIDYDCLYRIDDIYNKVESLFNPLFYNISYFDIEIPFCNIMNILIPQKNGKIKMNKIQK